MKRLRRSKAFEAETDINSVLSNLERLGAVEKSGLIGKPPRADLDALTEEASKRLGVPLAQVTLVEGHRQVFVNTFGLTGPLAEPAAIEMPLDDSFCKYVVAYKDVLVVEDAAKDPLVSSKTTEYGYHAYLGVPLKSRGEIIGSFCVYDDHPREWSLDDLNGLEEIAHEVMQHIDDQIEEDKEGK